MSQHGLLSLPVALVSALNVCGAGDEGDEGKRACSELEKKVMSRCQ